MSRQILIEISFLEPAIWKRVLNVMIVSSPAQYRSKMKGVLHLCPTFLSKWQKRRRIFKPSGTAEK